MVKNWNMPLIVLLLLLTGVSAIASQSGVSSHWKWRFLPGADVPGASGGLSEKDAGLTLDFDFSKGGAYVLAQLSASFPVDADRISMEIDTQRLTKPVALTFRVCDANGRWFNQWRRHSLLPGKKTPFVFDFKNEIWNGHWIPGKPAKFNQETSPQLPLKKFCIGVVKNAEEPKGSITMRNINAMTPSGMFNPSATGKTFTGDSFTLNCNGWTVGGKWESDSLGKILLSMTASSIPDTEQAIITVDFPCMTGMKTQRYKLSSGQTRTLNYSPPFEYAGGNPHNIYLLKICLDSASSSAETIVRLRGQDARETDFGAAVSSRKIANSKIGVCTHFGFASYETPQSQTSIHGIMRNHTELMDMVERAGIKWIRDNLLRFDRTPDGGYVVRPYDLDWLNEAQERKIKVIAVIGMPSSESLLDFARKCRDIASQTKDIDIVFELGNEPQNFGGWRKKYGGPWNGKEPDNSTSKWVLENLKYQNAGAEAIKKVRPDATVIGLGYPAATNFRALNAGVTMALDGVADHSYSHTAPAEKVAWSSKLKDRDGIEVGDEIGSVEGFIDSYQRQFQKTGHSEIELWVTEYGYSSYWEQFSKKKRITYSWLTEESQATSLAKRLIIFQSLPLVKVAAIHNLINIGTNPYDAEQGFGLLRNDEAPKLAYYTVSRLAGLLNEHEPDTEIDVKVETVKKHLTLFPDIPDWEWDGISVPQSGGFRAYAFKSKDAAKSRFIVMWSVFQLGDLNNISTKITISDSLADSIRYLVAYNLITGLSFDVPFKCVDGKIIVEGFNFGREPIVLRLYE